MIDDQIFIKPKATIFNYFHNLGDFFSLSFNQHYIPFFYLLNVGLFQLFQIPFPLYLVNLLLFYANCILAFSFIYLISDDFLIAFLTSIIFCIHPYTADVLEHITFNIILLQTIFILLGLISLYLFAKKNRSILYYLFSVLMALFSLFCQENALLFPLYAATLLFLLTNLKLKEIIKIIIPYVILDILFIILWFDQVNSFEHIEKVDSLLPSFFLNTTANFSHVFFWYLSNLFVPQNIVLMCNMQPLSNLIWFWNFLFFGFLILSCLLIFCYFKRSL